MCNIMGDSTDRDSNGQSWQDITRNRKGQERQFWKFNFWFGGERHGRKSVREEDEQTEWKVMAMFNKRRGSIFTH